MSRVISSDKPITVAVAVVTYGDRSKLLSQVLEGIFTQTVEDRINQVIVCDNGADEDSKVLLADIASREPRLGIVTLPVNTGSAHGYGEAIRAAAVSGCEYVWCLDDDTLPYSDALESLLSALGAVKTMRITLLSLRDDRPNYVRRARGASVQDTFERPCSFLGFSIFGVPKKIRRHLLANNDDELDSGAFVRDYISVPYAPYSGFFFKTELLQKVGFPRSEFYLYNDDYEFTSRFVTRGYSICLVPSSRIEDLERSWHRSRSNRSRWGGRVLLVRGEDNMLMRQFYSIRNRAFWEFHSLRWGVRVLYYVNTICYLLLLFFHALLLRSQGQELSWWSFRVILRAVRDGWRGRLGQVDEIAYSKDKSLDQNKSKVK